MSREGSAARVGSTGSRSSAGATGGGPTSGKIRDDSASASSIGDGTLSRSGCSCRGRRNVLGALAAVAACDRLGVAMASVQKGLEEFTGLARDFQMRGSFRGVSLVDDEAREPAAVEEALTLARRAFGSRRLCVVFTPPESAPDLREHGRFVSALSIADRVLIAEDEESARGAMSSVSSARTLTRALTTAGVRASRVSSLDDAISELDRHLEPGDVLVTLGAGDVGTIADAFIRRLPRDRQGR